MESSHQAEEEEEEEKKETAEDKLHQKLMNLQQDWDSFKQRRSSSISYSAKKHSSNAMVKALQLLETSPRNLMSSLQHSMLSPNLEGAWKVRTNDFAVQEIIRERREAIERGKVKGRRRLFHDVDNDNDNDDATDQIMGFEDQSHNCDFEVRSVSFNNSDHENESDGSKDDQINPSRSEGCSYSGSSYSSSSSLADDLKVERDLMEQRDEERKVL
ncbi:hypothetical protein FNV43_RR19670 [Rhamnella rubrinervis]|uniref:Uncharacterized protein n=1 Tax=Rhamnella rubrinervis TaxID=2594499 RepID=A0A8K0GPR1_9ROSA|nr:hypothetical protein FNV43_RR19670 [Rhamnella rubrinervis]